MLQRWLRQWGQPWRTPWRPPDQRRNVAIDHGSSPDGGQKDGGPAEEAVARSHSLYSCKEERAADSVVGLPEVQEREDGRGGEASSQRCHAGSLAAAAGR